MGPGIFLIVVGAVLSFAVRADTEAVDLQTMGLIFLVAGGVLVWHDRNGSRRERETTVVEDHSDPDRTVHTVREEVTEEDPYERLDGEQRECETGQADVRQEQDRRAERDDVEPGEDDDLGARGGGVRSVHRASLDRAERRIGETGGDAARRGRTGAPRTGCSATRG